MLLFIISFGGAITLCISFIKTCRSFLGKLFWSILLIIILFLAFVQLLFS